MKTVGIIYNARIPEALDLSSAIFHQLPLSQDSWLSPAEDLDSLRQRANGSDLIITVGGDGTILRAVQASAPNGIPMVGINMGRFDRFGIAELNELLMSTQPAHLQMSRGCPLTGEQRGRLRADILRKRMAQPERQER